MKDSLDDIRVDVVTWKIEWEWVPTVDISQRIINVIWTNNWDKSEEVRNFLSSSSKSESWNATLEDIIKTWIEVFESEKRLLIWLDSKIQSLGYLKPIDFIEEWSIESLNQLKTTLTNIEHTIY